MCAPPSLWNDLVWRSPRPLLNFQLYLDRYRKYAGVTGAPIAEVREAWNEIQSDGTLRNGLRVHLEKTFAQDRTRAGASISGPTVSERLLTLGRFSIVNAELYTLIRCLKPENVIETGVASGISSTLILRALEQNRRGKLVSIDLPNYLPKGRVNSDGFTDFTVLPEGAEPGWIVPGGLRHRWTLVIGDSREALPELLEREGNIDFFFHDSEHSNEVMGLEFRLAWSALRKRGVLYADDVFWNLAFPQFCREVGACPTDSVTAGLRGLLVRR